MAVGRTAEPKTFTGGTTNTDPTLTGPAGTFSEEDVGAAVSGTGIPAATTIATYTSDTSVEMSANATATGSPTVTMNALELNYGFIGWSPETDAESELYTIAGGGGASAPTRPTDDKTSALLRRARTAA